MSHETNMHRSPLLVAAAVAISAAGMVAVPATALATPMVPLAPKCVEYGWPGQTFLNHTNGWTVEFFATGPSVNGVQAWGTNPRSGHATIVGPMEGGIFGRNVDFRIHWDNNARGHYTGTVGDDGIARGDTVDELNPPARAAWISSTPIRCMKLEPPPPTPTLSPAPPPPPAPPQAPPPDPIAAAGFKPATVTADVEIYDAPGGNGNVIGELPGGEGQQVRAKCREDQWCEVAGTGWVFGGRPSEGGEPFLKF